MARPPIRSGAETLSRRPHRAHRRAAAWVPGGQREAGLALVAVMWMLAALMVTATGVVFAVRGEVRSAASVREMAVAGAYGDAGIVLAARELAAARERGIGLRQFPVTIEQAVVELRIVPLVGLIDLNAAAEPLLAELLAVAGELDRSGATRLAQRIVDWRDADGQPRPDGAEDGAYAAAGSAFRTRGGPFEAPEDLLQVLGVDFDLYAKVRGLTTVHLRGGGRVDPSSAPLPVLRVLAAGNEQLAVEYSQSREANGALADTTRFPAAYVARSTSSRFLLEASVQLSNGAFLVTRRVVDVAAGPDGVPWRTMWTERVVEPADRA
jgi:general secretion pathway protein K